jgi:hypothetical protein
MRRLILLEGTIGRAWVDGDGDGNCHSHQATARGGDAAMAPTGVPSSYISK